MIWNMINIVYPNNVLLVKGPVWYTIYHQLPVVPRGKQTPVLIDKLWEKDIYPLVI